LWLWYLRS